MAEAKQVFVEVLDSLKNSVNHRFFDLTAIDTPHFVWRVIKTRTLNNCYLCNDDVSVYLTWDHCYLRDIGVNVFVCFHGLVASDQPTGSTLY